MPIFLLAAVFSTTAHAGGDFCADRSIGKVVLEADGLRVVESPVPPLHTGDFVLQLNNHPLRTCSDLARALAEAKQEKIRALFLVRRAGEDLVLWMEPARSATTLSTPRSPTPAIERISGASTVRLLESLTELARFGRTLQQRLPLPTSPSLVSQLENVGNRYRKEAERDPAFRVLEPVLGYYETIGRILTYRREEARRHHCSVNRLPATLAYQSTSEVARWLKKYPFLAPSVREQPKKTTFVLTAEQSGYWSPNDAVRLLVEKAVSDTERLSGKLAAAGTGG